MGKGTEFNISVNNEPTKKLSHTEQETRTAGKIEGQSSENKSVLMDTDETETTEETVEIKEEIIPETDKRVEEYLDLKSNLVDTASTEIFTGTLKLTIHKGINLAQTGLIGKSDPYVVVEHDKKKFKSKTIKNNQNPVWEFVMEKKLYESSVEDIKISVFDEDIGKDDPMGYAFLNMQDLKKNKIITNKTLPLHSCKSGEIVFSSFFTESDVKELNPVLETTQFSEVDTMEKEKDDRKSEITLPKNIELDSCEILSEPSQSKVSLILEEEKEDIDAGHLKLIIHSGTNLMKTDIIGKSDPYVVVEHNKKKFKSKTIKNNQSPQWDFVVDCEIAENSDEDIKVSVFDEDIGKDDPMGYVFLDIKDLCVSKSIVTKNIKLNNCKTGEISFSSFYNEHSEAKEGAEPKIIVNTESTEKLHDMEQVLKVAERREEYSSKTEHAQSETDIPENIS